MKHWVFDLDGTLVDSFKKYFQTTEEIFSHFGARFSSHLHHAILTEPLAHLYERELGKENVEAALKLLQEKSNSDAEKVQPFPGVVETLIELKEKNVRIAVWTNRDLESATLILKHTGLHKYVELCVSGTCTVLRKPHPEGLLKVLQHFGCNLKDVIMIGDHEHDVTAAKTAGILGVRASWHGYWDIHGQCKIADYHFQYFHDFRKFAKELTGHLNLNL